MRERIESYDLLVTWLDGWFAFAKCADTFMLRKKVLSVVEREFSREISNKELRKYEKAFRLS